VVSLDGQASIKQARASSDRCNTRPSPLRAGRTMCHVLFLPDACVRLGPALILPYRDAGDNFLWSEPLHIGTY